jgi:hypothetical protein
MLNRFFRRIQRGPDVALTFSIGHYRKPKPQYSWATSGAHLMSQYLRQRWRPDRDGLVFLAQLEDNIKRFLHKSNHWSQPPRSAPSPETTRSCAFVRCSCFRLRLAL